MKKSNYEEALGDLNWLMGDEFDDTARHPKLNAQERLNMFIKVRNTFEQAKKQEKLLGHYKDLAYVRKELYDLTINFKQSNKDRMTILFVQETLVSDIIKEMEK